MNSKLHIRRYDFRHNHEVGPHLVNFPPKCRRNKKRSLTAQDTVQEETADAAAHHAPIQRKPNPACIIQMMNLARHHSEGEETSEEENFEDDDEELDDGQDGFQMCIPQPPQRPQSPSNVDLDSQAMLESK